MLSKFARGAANHSKKFVRNYSVGKDLRYGVECRALMLRGVEKLSNAVAATLGPKGRNVVIETNTFSAPKITKDGVTVAKNIDFSNKFENLGAQLVKQVASTTNDKAGDGTTTSTILALAIYSEGCKAVAAGMNPMDLKRGIDIAVKKVVEELEKQSKQITSKEEIAQVATISANGDTVIGQFIASAMERVGKNGVITVAEGKTLHNDMEVVEGMRLDKGFISPYFITNTKTQKCEYEKPWILVTDKKMSTIPQVLPILELVLKQQKPLLIVAEDVDAEALQVLLINKTRQGSKICAVKAPGFGDGRKNSLQDIAILTGATLITEDMGLKLENCDLSMLGTADKIEVTKDDTIILNGQGSKEDIQARCDEIADLMAKPGIGDYEKEKLQQRLAKLSGGVAVLKIGGASEVEVNEVKDRVVDALNATHAAVDEGIVAGGGSALLYCSKALSELKLDNFDQQHGVKIIMNALKMPIKTIAANAGVEGAVVVETLLHSKDTRRGYNAQTSEYVDMFKAGIVDPTKVVRTALVDAASVASLMTTTEVAIVPEDNQKGALDHPLRHHHGGGGMPDMF